MIKTILILWLFLTTSCSLPWLPTKEEIKKDTEFCEEMGWNYEIKHSWYDNYTIIGIKCINILNNYK